MTKTRRQLEALVEALDDVPVDSGEAKAAVKKMGVDIPALAGRIRGMIAEADARAVDARIAKARADLAEEIERVERRKIEVRPDRVTQLATFRHLLAKAPPAAVSVHFLKFESATDEELTELIEALRDLLGEDEEEKK